MIRLLEFSSKLPRDYFLRYLIIKKSQNAVQRLRFVIYGMEYQNLSEHMYCIQFVHLFLSFTKPITFVMDLLGFEALISSKEKK